MVVGVFPAAKLGALLLKQVSKPIANIVKEQAKSSPVFRKYVCIPPARFYHWIEVKTKMWVLNLGKPVNIPVLNEAMSIELGANLLGEGIIFTIAAAILISEYNRSTKKEAAKEAAKIAEMSQIQNTLKELFIQTEEQGAHIRELTRKMGDLETKLYGKKSDRPPKPPPSSSSGSAEIKQNESITERDDLINNNSFLLQNRMNNEGLLLRAVNDIRNEFINTKTERTDGIVSLSLEYLYRNVLKVNI